MELILAVGDEDADFECGDVIDMGDEIDIDFNVNGRDVDADGGDLNDVGERAFMDDVVVMIDVGVGGDFVSRERSERRPSSYDDAANNNKKENVINHVTKN